VKSGQSVNTATRCWRWHKGGAHEPSDTLAGVWRSSGFANIADVRQILMLLLALVLLYLGIVKKFEPCSWSGSPSAC
jgi:hypothetical protein